MGWELRHDGRRYLDRNRRVNGKPVKKYLAADHGFGGLMAHDLGRLQRRQAKFRRLTRKARAVFRGRVDDLLARAAGANSALRIVVGGGLYTLGYHRHNRGEWLMRRDLALLRDRLEQLAKRSAGPYPLVRYDAPTDDTEAVELFRKARDGDADALDRVSALIRDRTWAGWLGDLGRQATCQLIRKAAGGDPVWEEGIVQKANAIRQQSLGENPTVLEELLVRRVVNGWITVHALELELTVRPPVEVRDRAHLDAALTRAQKRMTEAIGELASSTLATMRRCPAAGEGKSVATARRQ